MRLNLKPFPEPLSLEPLLYDLHSVIMSYSQEVIVSDSFSSLSPAEPRWNCKVASRLLLFILPLDWTGLIELGLVASVLYL